MGKDAVADHQIEVVIPVRERRFYRSGLIATKRHIPLEPRDHVRVDVGAVDLDALGDMTHVTQKSPAATAEVEQPIEVRQRSGRPGYVLIEPHVPSEAKLRDRGYSPLEHGEVVAAPSVEPSCRGLDVLRTKRPTHSQDQVRWRYRTTLGIVRGTV